MPAQHGHDLPTHCKHVSAETKHSTRTQQAVEVDEQHASMLACYSPASQQSMQAQLDTLM